MLAPMTSFVFPSRHRSFVVELNAISIALDILTFAAVATAFSLVWDALPWPVALLMV